MDVLSNRDYTILIDKSGSMQETDTVSGQTRFKYAEESTIALARKLESFDPDGLTLMPFSGSFKVYDNVTAANVAGVFKENEPMGGTMLAAPLKEVFKRFGEAKKNGTLKSNGQICIVVTDGEPSDQAEVASTIVDFTKTLENGDGEFGLLFLQVGKDATATRWLKMLDDNLKGAKFDIVDVKTFDELEQIGITEALIASLND
jgi:uncharacterized protein YegL